MTDTFSGKVVLVTGGGSGIGRAAAVRFSLAGAAVGVLDRNGAATDEAARRVQEHGGHAVALVADVTDSESVSTAVQKLAAEYGGIDVAFNNAGIDVLGSVDDVNEDDWDRCLQVNAKGTFLVSRSVVPYLRARGGGAIVNQASVAGLVGVRGMAAYCASKGAVIALTRAMALDLAGDRIRVNAICPGTVHSPLTDRLLEIRGRGDRAEGLALTLQKYPIGRLGMPDEIAAMAMFLAGSDASFVTGGVFPVDGGMTAQ